ncbi:hypothetical protein MTO96_026348 [Rhipicephalus appendiculatus]
MRLSTEAAEVLGRYVEQSTALTTLNLKQFEPADGIVPFLNHLASNVSVKSMEVTLEMLVNEEGDAFADVVRRHVALNKLEGGLRLLSFKGCILTDVFAARAAARLRMDNRLQHLYVQENELTLLGNRMLLKALQFNTTLDVLGINIFHHKDLIVVYSVIMILDVSSRVFFHWENPLGSEYIQGQRTVLREHR